MGQVKTTLGGSEVSKTKTFEDDRHTEDMVKLFNLGRENEQALENSVDFSVSGPTVPPGFENSTKRIVTFDEDIRDSTDLGATCRGRVNRKEKNLVSLRLKDRVLRNKKSSLNKKEKQRELVETCEILGDLSSSEEDFSNTDVEASKTWTLGTG
ncbi:hypothetical protein PIB30_114706, partial [Stylosanthes scabra]|nr:hypothetical protein [Stylosanthes scabra]